MFIVSSFDYTANVEAAIASLRENGVDKQHILAVPLIKKAGVSWSYGSLGYSKSVSLLDGPAILGCIFMLLGCIYGFVWKGGPVLLGLFGLAAGLFVGFLADFI